MVDFPRLRWIVVFALLVWFLGWRGIDGNWAIVLSSVMMAATKILSALGDQIDDDDPFVHTMSDTRRLNPPSFWERVL